MNFCEKKVAQQAATKVQVLPEMCKKMNIYIYIYSNKTWINENDTAKKLPFLDMTCKGNQYKFDSEL